MNSPENPHSSGNKPYEHLNADEKAIFNICGEIIAYRRGGVDDEKLLGLRERATDLFTKMREVDYVNDDSYYKLTGEANALRQEFQKIKELEKEAGHEYIDLGNNLEDVAGKLIAGLAGCESVRTDFKWVSDGQPVTEEDQAGEFYDDRTGVSIVRQEQPDKFTLSLSEMFNSVRFSSNPHIKDFYKKIKTSNAELHRHEHAGGTIEFWLTVEDLSIDQVKEMIDGFVEIIKANPRK